jgi:hypothetical protein
MALNVHGAGLTLEQAYGAMNGAGAKIRDRSKMSFLRYSSIYIFQFLILNS